jgi:hypothetical protein
MFREVGRKQVYSDPFHVESMTERPVPHKEHMVRIGFKGTSFDRGKCFVVVMLAKAPKGRGFLYADQFRIKEPLLWFAVLGKKGIRVAFVSNAVQAAMLLNAVCVDDRASTRRRTGVGMQTEALLQSSYRYFAGFMR